MLHARVKEYFKLYVALGGQGVFSNLLSHAGVQVIFTTRAPAVLEIITQIECCGAKFYHKHDLEEGLISERR